MTSSQLTAKHWYVMRDLTRCNASCSAYRQLQDCGLEVFTPMKWILRCRAGRKVRKCIPIIHDLLFVHESRNTLDSIVERIPTLQYRYSRGGAYCEPMVVADEEMNRFIHAVEISENPKYFLPAELTASMYGRTVRVIGGALNGYVGKLLKVKGLHNKRLLVELPGFMTVGIETDFDYVQLAE